MYSYLVVSKTIGHSGITLGSCQNDVDEEKVRAFLITNVGNDLTLPEKGDSKTYEFDPLACSPDTMSHVVVFCTP